MLMENRHDDSESVVSGILGVNGVVRCGEVCLLSHDKSVWNLGSCAGAVWTYLRLGFTY